jgi:hypothetical protein
VQDEAYRAGSAMPIGKRKDYVIVIVLLLLDLLVHIRHGARSEEWQAVTQA